MITDEAIRIAQKILPLMGWNNNYISELEEVIQATLDILEIEKAANNQKENK